METTEWTGGDAAVDADATTLDLSAAEVARAASLVQANPVQPVSDPAARLVVTGLVSDKGGMGLLHAVFDQSLLRTLVRKTVRPSFGADRSAIGLLIEEAQITSQLDHPNIVPVHELGLTDDGSPFYTMKYVRGRDLNQVLAEQDPATRSDHDLYHLLQVFLKVCDAIAFAHSRGVIHRDLKPDNIMVGEFGETYVMDWGIAKLKGCARSSGRDHTMPALTRTQFLIEDDDGQAVGTPGYMAPEQACGTAAAIDERTDVFCLGAILFEILTGQPPYHGETAQEVVALAQAGVVPRPEHLVGYALPRQLCDIAMKAMARSHRDRHQSATELGQEVEDFLQGGWRLATRRYPAGSLIIREGDVGDEAYLIREGRCLAFRTGGDGRIALREMGRDEVFGETSVLTGEARSASVEAVDDVTVAVVSRQALLAEVGTATTLGHFVTALAARFRERDERVRELERVLATAGLAL